MHKACVLLLEDDPTELEIFRRRIEKYRKPGDSIHVARSGAEAIAVIEELAKTDNRPCIFVLDLTMPGGVQGFDVLRWIRQQPEYDNCAVIILTSSDSPSDKKRAFDLGATRFFTKPRTGIEVGTLLKTILEEFRGRGHGGA